MEPCKNTDRVLWRDPLGDTTNDYYANSIHVTKAGGIGIDVGGAVIVKLLADWHQQAKEIERLQEELHSAEILDAAARTDYAKLKAERDQLAAEVERLTLKCVEKQTKATLQYLALEDQHADNLRRMREALVKEQLGIPKKTEYQVGKRIGVGKAITILDSFSGQAQSKDNQK